MKKYSIFLLLICSFTLGTTSTTYALNFFGYDIWGETYQDAEKSQTNTEDDLMCWAATASNMLNWTGWGNIYSTSYNAEDNIFTYFQNHWTDRGGNMYFGVEWWFDGTNNSQGWSDWSQVDIPGGGFYPSFNFSDYYTYAFDYGLALENIDTYLHEGYGVGLAVIGPGGHAITTWGYEYDDQGNYLGIYVTDSDDGKYQDGAPDELRYYEVSNISGAWYLQDFYGSDSWYIAEVHGLARYPGLQNPDNGTQDPSGNPLNPVPEPTTMLLLGSGLVGLAGFRRKFRKK